MVYVSCLIATAGESNGWAVEEVSSLRKRRRTKVNRVSDVPQITVVLQFFSLLSFPTSCQRHRGHYARNKSQRHMLDITADQKIPSSRSFLWNRNDWIMNRQGRFNSKYGIMIPISLGTAKHQTKTLEYIIPGSANTPFWALSASPCSGIHIFFHGTWEGKLSQLWMPAQKSTPVCAIISTTHSDPSDQTGNPLIQLYVSSVEYTWCLLSTCFLKLIIKKDRCTFVRLSQYIKDADTIPTFTIHYATSAGQTQPAMYRK